MADTFKSLAEKYDNFMAPAMKITVTGKETKVLSVVFSTASDYDEDILVVDGVNISLSIDHASSLKFNVLNAYNIKTGSFNLDSIGLGDTIEVSIGYGSKLKVLFKGYIHERSYDLSDSVYISVTALDARALMEKHEEPSCPADITTDEKEKKTENVLKGLLDNYKGILSYSNIKLEGAVKPRGLNMTDWDYLQSILGEGILSIDSGELFKIDPDAEETVTLEYGEGLNSFSFSEVYQNIELVTETFDESDPSKTSIVSAKVESDGNKSTSRPQKIFINPLSHKTKEEAEQAINMQKQKIKRDAYSITADVIGIPEITAGKVIRFAGLVEKIGDKKKGEDSFGKFVVTDAVHIFNSSGYKTSISVTSKSELKKMIERAVDKKITPSSAFGTVVAHEDDMSEHGKKVKVKIKNELGNEENEMWARLASPSASEGNGIFMRPEIDSDVIVNFVGGDMQHPVVVGSVWNDRNTANEENKSEQNYIKEIRTKAGNCLRFDDNPDSAVVQLNTVSGQKIYIDDKEKTILITTSDNSNSIKLSENDGSITMNAKEKITFQINGESKIDVDKDKISFSTENFEVSANSKISLEKGEVKISGSSLSLGSSGNAEISGSQVNVKGDASVLVSGQIIKLG